MICTGTSWPAPVTATSFNSPAAGGGADSVNDHVHGAGGNGDRGPTITTTTADGTLTNNVTATALRRTRRAPADDQREVAVPGHGDGGDDGDFVIVVTNNGPSAAADVTRTWHRQVDT